MNIKTHTLLTCTLLALPGAALAQEFSGAATLGYAHTSASNGGGDANTLTLDGVGTLGFQNGFSLNMDGSFSNVDSDSAGGDLNVTDLGLELRYRMYSGAVVGGYIDYVDFSDNGTLSGDVDATSYGLMGGYAGELLRVEGNIGWTDASATGVGSTSDWMDYGLNVTYTPTQNTKIAGHWQLSDVNTTVNGSNLYSVGVGANHNFGSGIVGFGGIDYVDFSAANVDATSFGAGVGYDLSQVSGIPGMVSLELARTNLDAGGGANVDVDTIRLGFTLATGARGTGAPLNSVADSVMRPRHNALSTLYDNIF